MTTSLNRAGSQIKTWAAIAGCAGGLLAFIGLFLPWATASGWGYSGSISGWNLATASGGADGVQGYALLVLLGAIFAVACGVGVLVTKARLLSGLLGLVGLLVVIGAAWALGDIETGSLFGVSVSRGSGLYLSLVGGILAMAGVIGLRE